MIEILKNVSSAEAAKIARIEENKRGFRKATISSKDSTKNFFPGGTNHDVIWLAEQASTNEDFGETANFLKHLTFRKIGSFFIYTYNSLRLISLT